MVLNEAVHLGSTHTPSIIFDDWLLLGDKPFDNPPDNPTHHYAGRKPSGNGKALSERAKDVSTPRCALFCMTQNIGTRALSFIFPKLNQRRTAYNDDSVMDGWIDATNAIFFCSIHHDKYTRQREKMAGTDLKHAIPIFAASDFPSNLHIHFLLAITNPTDSQRNLSSSA